MLQKFLGSANTLDLSEMLAGSTGLEPAASGVTGRRSNQLNYDPESHCGSRIGDCGLTCEPEIRHPNSTIPSGRYRIRTCDSRRVKPVLYHCANRPYRQRELL